MTAVCGGGVANEAPGVPTPEDSSFLTVKDRSGCNSTKGVKTEVEREFGLRGSGKGQRLG